MNKHFIEIIEEGESCTVVHDTFMCRNKDYKDPYMCRNKDFKDPFMLDKEISQFQNIPFSWISITSSLPLVP